jgi:hypothetical protein
MKLHTFLFLLPVLLISCSSCGSRKVNNAAPELPYHIDLTKSPPHDLFLSDFAEDISYVRLESNDVLVGGLCNLFIGQDRFIINDFQQELLVFSKDGRFLNKIGNIGHGPQEYQYTNNFQVDWENRKYYLIRDHTNEIMVFSLDGKFERSFRFAGFSERMEMLFSHLKFYISGTAIQSKTYTPLIIYLTDGTKWKEYTLQLPPMNEKPETAPYGQFELTMENEVLLNNLSWDTSYLISDNGDRVPYAVFYRGPDPMPYDQRFFFNRWNFYKDQNYTASFIRDMGLEIIMNNNVPPDSTVPSFYIKETGKLFQIRNFEKEKDMEAVGIQNNLDGGPMLIWQFKREGNYIYCLHQAINLINWKKSGYFDRIEPKFPEKKQKLFDMIDSLKPDDNPVIMIVKLKAQ